MAQSALASRRAWDNGVVMRGAWHALARRRGASGPLHGLTRALLGSLVLVVSACAPNAAPPAPTTSSSVPAGPGTSSSGAPAPATADALAPPPQATVPPAP